MTELILYVVVIYLASLGALSAVNRFMASRPVFKNLLKVGMIAFWITVVSTTIVFGWEAILVTIAMNGLIESSLIKKK